MSICFCTIAFHAPYRHRARILVGDAPGVPWIVLTDADEEFADLPVRAIQHSPTGPMAPDYLAKLPPTGEGRGAAAYHDKRFALIAALRDFDTAVYVDADSRISVLPPLGPFAPGLSVLPLVHRSVADHLELAGTWRAPALRDLARHLTGDAAALQSAWWCHEALMAITRDGREARFFEAWSVGAGFLQERGVFSGEGGVIGLAALCAGWDVDFVALDQLGSAVEHEGGGPKHD